MRLHAVAAVGIVLFVLSAPARAFACSCMTAASPCSAIGAPGAIFIGTPVAVEPAVGPLRTNRLRFRFTVERSIQGVATRTVNVETAADSAACGYPFKTGVSYLVYAHVSDAGSYSATICSRTGTLESRRDDLELLTDTLAGRTIQPRLFGVVYQMHLRLDGFYMRFGEESGLPDVPIRVRDQGALREARTGADGHFSIAGLAPGRHVVEMSLPARFEPLFDKEIVSKVDACFGEVVTAVTTVPLRGTISPLIPENARQVALRLAQLGPDSATFERSTLAFVEADGTWKVPGLPPGRYVVGLNAFEAPSAQVPYPTSWYPGVSQPAQATVLEVSDDRQISIAFHMPAPLPLVTLKGVTVDESGKPVPGANITLHDSDQHAGLSATVGSATSDSEGRFSMPTIRGRHFQIEAASHHLQFDGTTIRNDGPNSELQRVSDEDLQRGVTIVLKPRPNP
jgi:hypothetical protein